jgi:hypothetical protein
MRRNGVLRSPPVDDVKDIGCIRLLIQVVVEASGLPPSGSDKFEQKPLHLRAVERLAAYLEGDPFGGPVAMRLGVGGSWSTVGRTRLG